MFHRTWKSLAMAVVLMLAARQAVAAAPSPWVALAAENWRDVWQAVDGQPIGDGWEWSDQQLHLNADGRRGGNLVSREEFGDFELMFDWKIAAQGNNGIKYRVRPYGEKTLGIEYQLIDDGVEGLRPEQLTAAVYDLFPTDAQKPLTPVGQYHHSRIVVRHNHVEHWLDGLCVAYITVGDARWRDHVANSKFGSEDRFGENPVGRLMLTDHQSEAWFRNLYVRRLDDVPTSESLPFGQSCGERCGDRTAERRVVCHWRRCRRR